ncbi:MAG: diaminopimelate epimerase [Proteobacteria bacterium]|nr:diaminopimelate epimerase [Pseudomonadota bacterium]
MKIPFFKMSGCGNDFIIIDNRSSMLGTLPVRAFAQALCRRTVSVGADGLILIEKPRGGVCDFSWRFFNSDGSEAEMCGNGGRCAARYAVLKGIAGSRLSFETLAGIIHAEVNNSLVKIELPSPGPPEMNLSLTIDGEGYLLHVINTGVPHVVTFVNDLDARRVREHGTAIRFHQRFQPAGTNVNFVSVQNHSLIHLRTYERGVEDETRACGTGSVAAALIASALGSVSTPVQVKTAGGEVLTVYSENPSHPFGRVYLEGPVTAVCEGDIWEEAYK